eukprot:TRINITY_DN9137_c1_g3_i2.p1 TRINITY_DN9137_c1_g3~~TRINITY_DN9137_c1_g3_i2.p1  ORF type:complete len:403 (+),score=178.33 TRINITY_DN9137_c1_g3_i2:58-1266(+)
MSRQTSTLSPRRSERDSSLSADALRSTLGQLQRLAFEAAPSADADVDPVAPSWSVHRPQGRAGEREALRAAAEALDAQSDRIAELTAANDQLSGGVAAEERRREEAEAEAAGLRRRLAASEATMAELRAEADSATAEAAAVRAERAAALNAVESLKRRHQEVEEGLRRELRDSEEARQRADARAAEAGRCSDLLAQLREREQLSAAMRTRISHLEGTISDLQAAAERDAASWSADRTRLEQGLAKAKEVARERREAYEGLRQNLDALVARLGKQLKAEAAQREAEQAGYSRRIAELEGALRAREIIHHPLQQPPPPPPPPPPVDVSGGSDPVILSRIERHLAALASAGPRGEKQPKEGSELKRLRRELRRSREELRVVNRDFDAARQRCATGLPDDLPPDWE